MAPPPSGLSKVRRPKPTVRADLVEFPQYATLVFERGAKAGVLELNLSDANLEDTLYVRIFVDYDLPDPTPPRSTCIAAAHSGERSATCPMEDVCQQQNVGQTPPPLLQVFVFDRDYEPALPPLYQGVAPGGLSASQTFFLRCQEASQ